jgi:nucleoside 2-deoxyribosyltransferase
MRVYVAASYLDKSKARELMKAFEPRGHTITHDWTNDGNNKDDWEIPIEKRSLCAINDIGGIRRANVLVIFGPGRRGTHTEMGIALALQKPIIMIQAQEPHGVFYSHPSVVHVSSVDKALELVDNMGSKRDVKETERIVDVKCPFCEEPYTMDRFVKWHLCAKCDQSFTYGDTISAKSEIDR